MPVTGAVGGLEISGPIGGADGHTPEKDHAKKRQQHKEQKVTPQPALTAESSVDDSAEFGTTQMALAAKQYAIERQASEDRKHTPVRKTRDPVENDRDRDRDRDRTFAETLRMRQSSGSKKGGSIAITRQSGRLASFSGPSGSESKYTPSDASIPSLAFASGRPRSISPATSPQTVRGSTFQEFRRDGRTVSTVSSLDVPVLPPREFVPNGDWFDSHDEVEDKETTKALSPRRSEAVKPDRTSRGFMPRGVPGSQFAKSIFKRGSVFLAKEKPVKVVPTVHKTAEEYLEYITNIRNTVADKKAKTDFFSAFIMIPHRRWWYDLIIVFPVMIYNLIMIPYALSFQIEEYYKNGQQVVVDAIYMLDILFSFVTSYKQEGVYVVDHREVALHYFYSRKFVYDFLSGIPVGLIILGTDDEGLITTLLLVRCIKVFNAKYLAQTLANLNKIVEPGFLAACRLIAYTLVAIHVLACASKVVVNNMVNEENVEFLLNTQYYVHEDHWKQYIVHWYWILTAVLGNQVPIPANEPGAVVFTSLVTMVGICCYSLLIGNIVNFVRNMDRTSAAFRNEMENVNHYMRKMDVPEELQDHIQAHFSLLFQNTKGIDNFKLLERLPKHLSDEMTLHLNQTLIHKVDLFRGCTTAFLTTLLKGITQSVVVAGDIVFNQGEPGTELFFLLTGNMQVVMDDVLVTVLVPGSYFGVSALISDDCIRKASVVAITDCSMAILHKDHFEDTVRLFPDDSELILSRCEAKVHLMGAEKEAGAGDEDKQAAPLQALQPASAEDILEYTASPNLSRPGTASSVHAGAAHKFVEVEVKPKGEMDAIRPLSPDDTIAIAPADGSVPDT